MRNKDIQLNENENENSVFSYPLLGVENLALKYTESNKSIHILQFPNTLHIKLQFFKKLS